MIRLLFPLLLICSFAYAGEKQAVSESTHEAQAGRAPHQAGEDHDQMDCPAKDMIEGYSRSAEVVKMTQHPIKVNVPKKLSGKKLKATASQEHSMLFVRLQMKAAHLTVNASEEDDIAMPDDTMHSMAQLPARPGSLPAPHEPKDADPWLYNNGYVNLMNCAKYADALRDAKNVPKGAIVIYAGGHEGKAEIKTPSGWYSDKPRSDSEFAKDMKVLGIYVKPMI
jgi:hypothetical protein